MITYADIRQHKARYPTFDDQRLIAWLKANHNWHWFKTVAKASRLMHRYINCDKYAQSVRD